MPDANGRVRPVFFNVDIPWHLEAFNDDHEQMTVEEPKQQESSADDPQASASDR